VSFNTGLHNPPAGWWSSKCSFHIRDSSFMHSQRVNI